MHRCVLRRWGVFCIPVIALIAADSPWKTKPAAQWTEQDARQVLTNSPWARQIRAGVARRLSEDELRDGGQMGQPHGIGYDGVDPKSSGPKLPSGFADLVTPAPNGASARSRVQAITLRLRWESALPVQLAQLKSRESESPSLEGGGYRITVYGIPGGFKGDPKKLSDPLKSEASLQREGKKDVKPSDVEVILLSDGWAVQYLFPLSAEISSRDKQVEFEAHIGRIVVQELFELAAMEFQGKLEI